MKSLPEVLDPPHCHFGIHDWLVAAAKQVSEDMFSKYPTWDRLKNGYGLTFNCKCGQRLEVPFT